MVNKIFISSIIFIFYFIVIRRNGNIVKYIILETSGTKLQVRKASVTYGLGTDVSLPHCLDTQLPIMDGYLQAVGGPISLAVLCFNGVISTFRLSPYLIRRTSFVTIYLF